MRDVTQPWLALGSTPDIQLASIIRLLDAHFVGIAGSPGSGKSTLARLVADQVDGLVISMDDFYLSRVERTERGLAWRGPPGSHDVAQLLDVLDRLREHRTPITIPRFSGEIDDRIEPIVLGDVPDRVLVEGWVIGHAGDGYGAILDRLDLLVFIDVPDETARSRRFAREAELRARGGGFSEAEMRRFWDEVLGPGMAKWVREAKDTADLVLELDGDELRRARTSSDAVTRALEDQSISGAG